jgi:hypothetical protein
MHSLEDNLQAAQELNESGGQVDESKMAEFQNILETAKQLHRAEKERFSERQKRKEQREKNSQERKKAVEKEMLQLKAGKKDRKTQKTVLTKLFSNLQVKNQKKIKNLN